MPKDLLLNLLLILVPIFVFQVLFMNRLSFRPSRFNHWWLGVLSGLASDLCMAFPIVFGKGYVWDLHWVPYEIAILYGGWRSGITASLMVFGYRFYMSGGLAVAPFFLVASTLIVGGLWLHQKYIHFDRSQKIASSVGLTMAAFLVMMVSVWYSIDANYQAGLVIRWFYLVYAGSHVFSILFSVLLIENLLESVRMREEIRKSEKLSIISDLAASIAHEVRNPLTVVRGFIQLAAPSFEESNRRHLATAILELDRAEFVIADYLNFAKPEQEHLERFAIAYEVRSVVHLLQSFATSQQVELKVEVEDALCVCADKFKLKQALLNLVKNAIEAVSAGGCVEILVQQKGVRVEIVVKDNGAGMTPEQVERLGKMLYTTKENGTGLGLLVTYRLIEAMQGELTFFSEKHKGTQAKISIPALRPLNDR